MRRYRSISFFLILMFMTSVIFYYISTKVYIEDANIFDKLSVESLSEIENIRKSELLSDAVKNAIDIESLSSRPNRHVTPSLAELGDRGYLPNVNENVLMVTRVPNAGAELLVLLLQRLQGYNAFKHIRLPRGDSGTLSSLQQELLVEEITSIIRQEAIPLSFDGDVRFLNFSTFGRQSPTFISIVRDPLDPKILNRFRNGDSSVIYSGSIAHFCGQDIRCNKRNNKWALNQAKANVMKWYPVVGILNYIEDTILVLQSEFPRFFKGATDIYNKIRIKQFNPKEFALAPDSKKRLQRILEDEINFYYWLKSRLFQQTSYIKSAQIH